MLKASAFSLGGLAATLQGATPSQPEGPFHPVNIDNDLRRLNRGSPFASGQQIKIHGQVLRSDTKAPVSGAYIEIWQADENGKYAHPSDPLPVDPDPNFQFWGRAGTDHTGRYEFFSIKPGSYPAGAGWTRPPHIHLHISRRGFQALTTQLYFAGEPLNKLDRLLNQVPANEQYLLITSLEEDPATGLWNGSFNIELDPV